MAALVLSSGFAQEGSTVSLDIRLTTPVSSYSAKAGDAVTGTVIAPAHEHGHVVIPVGSVVRGKVEQAKRVGLGLRRSTARLVLAFDQVDLPDGRRHPMSAQVVEVDNAREWVDHKGVIRGQRGSTGIAQRLGMSVWHTALRNPFGFVPWFALQNCLFRFPNPEIEYGVGTEMRLAVRSSPALKESHEEPEGDPALSHEELNRIQEIAARLPYWSYSVRQREPMDAINLLFIGSQDAVQNAFRAAGWSGSLPNSTRASIRAVRAIAERKAFPDAPMRTLLADGAAPDMTWQKTLNTLAKRHHLRVWKRPDEFRGKAVWASAATHDVSVRFSPRFGFVHQINLSIDPEREKVINDLLMTGCVDGVVNVPREAVSGPGRDGIQTDGVLAAVLLNACEHPTAFPREEYAGRRPGAMTRLVRRITLCAQNHFIENNVPWQGSLAAVSGIRSLRNRHRVKHEEEASLKLAGLETRPGLAARPTDQ